MDENKDEAKELEQAATEEPKAPENQDKKGEDNYMALGMALGMCFGMSIGQFIFDNLATGLSIGMMLGMVIGMNIKKK